MKRLRSTEDLDSYGKDNPNRNPSPNPNPNPNPSRTSSSSHRSVYYNKPDTPRKGLLSSSSSASSLAAARSYDRERGDDDREPAGGGGSRIVRKRPADHDFDGGFDRRKGVDRYSRDGGGGGGYDRNTMHRSESFCGGGSRSGIRGSEFPKGFRSERDRSRREGSSAALSWRRFGKEFEEGRSSSNVRLEERAKAGGGFRDVVRSPSWSNSRDSGSEQSRVRSPPSRRFKEGKSSKSPTSKSKSPTWSKDSVGSEQSKSVEVKKSEPDTEPEPEPEPEPLPEPVVEPEPVPEPEPEHVPEPEPEPELVPEAEAVVEEVQGESGSRTSSSEMEEGELEPEAEPEAADAGEEPQVVPEAGAEVEESRVQMGSRTETRVVKEEKDRCLDNEEVICEAKKEEKKEDEAGNVRSEESKEGEKEVSKERLVEMEEEEKGIDLEVKAEDDEMTESDREVTEEDTGVHTLNLSADLTWGFKDKGKSVVVHVEDSAEDSGWAERQSRELLTCMDNDMEGPSTRGFELFTSSPVRRQEKADSGVKMKDEKLVLEPLDLSLSLPNVLLPIGAAPGSPHQATSVQSLSNTFCTNSEGFTQSVSFSGSQSFYHNPSCSLTTQNSMDFEQSVKSRPLFQGIDWQALAQNEAKNKEVPFYQKASVVGNGSHSQAGVSNGQSGQGQQPRHPEGSSKVANGFERQLSFHKQLSGGQPKQHDDVRSSPAQSVGSHEMGSNYSFDKKRLMREKSNGSLYRTSSQKDKEQLPSSGADFLDTIIARIVSDPIHVMAKKFHEMTGQSAACMKDSIREVMLNVDKRMQLSAFQKALQNRSDITLEILLKAHRAQLEILVALKTGLPDFLQQESSVPSSDLAETFLCLRCRNPSCRSPVPVDECDCKVCSQKNGFCSACMCLVCSKFDMASNTCSWIGCDVCLHWCHADCALRESFIRNGHSATGSQGMTEMQFHCVACDHPSEMFGFVKEVFQNFAKDWTVENLARELEYVKRIFLVSKDMRGRQMHEIAVKSLTRLENKAGLPEVYSYIMAFLVDADSSKPGKTPILSGKDQGKVSSGIAGASQEPAWLKSVYTDKSSQLAAPPSILPSFNYDQHDKRIMESDLHMSSQKEPAFDELESIVRIKQAEAEMFQTRADEARKEAEGVKRIAVAKNEKIEEEYRSRITKLRFIEAEEMRKKKLEELQSLDRSHREYSNMKMRMEEDIKDLLLKMEATKRNLSL